jgi:hypothetical protein
MNQPEKRCVLYLKESNSTRRAESQVQASGQRCFATINTKELANITMSESNHQAALLAIEKVLALLRSVKTLEGTDKDGVEHLLQMAVDNLKN